MKIKQFMKMEILKSFILEFRMNEDKTLGYLERRWTGVQELDFLFELKFISIENFFLAFFVIKSC